MSTAIYSFGVHYKWAKNLPELVVEQLRLANRFKNQLVEIERDYEDAKTAVWSSAPQIAEIEQALAEAEQEIAVQQDVVADERMRQKMRDPRGDRVTAAKTALADASKRARTLRAKRRDEISAAFEKDPQIQQRLTQTRDTYRQETKDAYHDTTVDEGLYDPTAYQVKQAHATSVKNLTTRRSRGEYARLRFHRFDGTGVLGGKNPSNQGIRAPERVGDPAGPFRNQIMIPYLDPDEWEKMTGAERRKAGRVTARFRVKSGRADESVVDIPIQMHRPFPPDSEIKSASLVVKRQGTRTVASLDVRVSTPDAEPLTVEGTVAVHFGWRRENDAVRAMTWISDRPLEEWTHLANDPRYRDLARVMRVSSDLTSGTVLLPDAWNARTGYDEEQKSVQDAMLNDMRERLASWLDDTGPVDHPGRFDRDTGEQVQVSATDVRRWKAPGRFARLAMDWRNAPPAQEGGEQIAADLEAWRAADKKLTDQRAGARSHVSQRRDDVYNQIANLFTGAFERIVMDDTNHAALAQLPGEDPEITNQHSRRLGWQRKNVAAATLRQKIIQAGAREGVTVERLRVPAVSADCVDCGTRNIRVEKTPSVTCRGCGETYDIDTNAVRHLQLAAA